MSKAKGREAGPGSAGEGAGEGGALEGEEPLPHVDFATFIVSLSHSALMHLGEVPHPDSNSIEVHLPMARQSIDLLGLLEEKTKGNLTGDEERLLSQILFDLRTRFLEKSKK